MPLRAETVVKLANGEWAPFQSQELKHYGVASYLVEQAFAHVGIQVEYAFRPWKRAYEEAKSGKLDGTLIWRKNAERQNAFYFSDVLIASESAIFHLKSLKFAWTKDEDLKGYVVGGTLGYQYSYDNIPGVRIERAGTDEQNFGKLLLKRIDLFGLDKLVGYDILNKYFTAEQRAQITYEPNPGELTKYYLMLSRAKAQNQQIIRAFNRGLKYLRDSGRYEEIMQMQLRGEFLGK